MSKAIPETLFMWLQSNEQEVDAVVHIETAVRPVKVGDKIWSDGLDRFGQVEAILPNITKVRVL